MKRIFVVAGICGALALSGRAEEERAHLADVVGILRTNLNGVTEAQLDDAGIRGLARELKPRVLLENGASDAGSIATNVTVSSRMFGDFAYLRVRRVTPGVGAGIVSALKDLQSGGTNAVKGVVLDLRFSSGDDYAAAGSAASVFIGDERPLLECNGGVIKSDTNTNAVTLPLAVMINGETAGAAEALGAVLRDAQCGLLVGNKTSGEALVYKEFALSDGRKLKVAGSSVILPGKGPLPTHGLAPDIAVSVPLNDEKLFYLDPYRVAKPSAVPAENDDAAADDDDIGGSHRLNEAELVRLQKQGISPEEALAGPPAAPRRISEAELVRQKRGGLAGPPVKIEPRVTDPALGRSLDLLKGISVARGKSA